MKHKHKKTRKQKIIADYRHNSYTLENKNIISLNPAIITSSINGDTHSYSYVLHDILKTGFLTLSIIAGELILYLLLKNHTITLPKISY